MLAAPLLLLALGTPTSAAEGLTPEALDRAKSLEAPIAGVTVFGDQAEVRRTAEPTLPAGRHVVRFPDLPGSVMEASVRVTARGAKVLRVETERTEAGKVSLEEVARALDALELADDAKALLDAEVAARSAVLESLGGLGPAPVSDEERRGPMAPPLAPEAWKRSLDFLDDARARARTALREATARRDAATERVRTLRMEVERLDPQALSTERLSVAVLLEVTGRSRPRLELTYRLPGARWTPAWEVRWVPERGALQLFFAGQVTQGTGEDWSQVALGLSTAAPDADPSLPRLATWTLGEAKAFTPTPRAKRRPEPRLPWLASSPPPTPVVTTDLALEQLLARREQLLLGRGGHLGQLRPARQSAGALDYRAVKSGSRQMDFADESIEAELVAPSASPPPAPPPGRAIDSVRIASTGRAESARPSPSPLALLEPGGPMPRPRAQRADDPAALAGGLAHLYAAPARTTVPSRSEATRVPLAVQTFAATTLHETAPGVEPRAYLVARIENKTEAPILGGPALIFSAGSFVAEGRLDAAGPGGALEVPLGPDEDLQVSRKVVAETVTSGLFSKRDATHYEVSIELVNHRERATVVRVTEPLPKSSRSEIEVELVSATPKLAEGPDAQGLVRWQVEVAPKGRATLKLAYRIGRPADWQLWQH